ncbi:MAG: hypothetical protein MJY52_00685 [Bacteroidaceae bacterium]|nr:hypothetical protein [Bacteroidaceae bacterium]
MARIYDNIDVKFTEGLQGIITNVGVKRVDFCVGHFNQAIDLGTPVYDKHGYAPLFTTLAKATKQQLSSTDKFKI